MVIIAPMIWAILFCIGFGFVLRAPYWVQRDREPLSSARS
jgi:hypothetical protein